MSRFFAPEFKAQIAAIYRQGGRTFSDIAREYDISPTSVAAWVREHDVDSGQAEATTRDDKRVIAELRRELARKEEELEILGKAVAFFVRKQDQ
jgi:transposase